MIENEGIADDDVAEIMNQVFPKTFNNIKLILNDYWEQI